MWLQNSQLNELMYEQSNEREKKTHTHVKGQTLDKRHFVEAMTRSCY
jgi:hypothetical protein